MLYLAVMILGPQTGRRFDFFDLDCHQWKNASDSTRRFWLAALHRYCRAASIWTICCMSTWRDIFDFLLVFGKRGFAVVSECSELYGQIRQFQSQKKPLNADYSLQLSHF